MHDTREVAAQTAVRRTLVRYTVHEAHAANNAALVERVFAELAITAPAGLRYAAFRLDDGISFVHLVSQETGDGSDILRAQPAFAAFRSGLAERVTARPVATRLREIGSYRFGEY